MKSRTVPETLSETQRAVKNQNGLDTTRSRFFILSDFAVFRV